MKQYLGFASGLISYACFTIYHDRKEFKRLTKEIDEKQKKIFNAQNCINPEQSPQK
jgi:hypothetical protein